jgi:hypothetical protein
MIFLLLSSYFAMIFNALATMASLVLIDRLGDMELTETGSEENIAQPRNIGSLELLLNYGMGNPFRYVFRQCE